MTEVTDRYGDAVAPRMADKSQLCATVTTLADGSVIACGYSRGHRSLHSWHALPGATSSKPPGPRGEDRARRGRQVGSGRPRMPEHVCGAVADVGGVPVVCAHESVHSGSHSWAGLVADEGRN